MIQVSSVMRNVYHNVDRATAPSGISADCAALDTGTAILTTLTALRVKAIKCSATEINAIFMTLRCMPSSSQRNELLCEMFDMKLITKGELSGVQGVDVAALDGVVERTQRWCQRRRR